MTVAVAPRYQNFTGSGITGPFTFNFPILISNLGTPYITVTQISAAGVATVLSYPADYSFSAVSLGLGGGIITTTLAVPGDGSRLFVEAATPLDQGVKYSNQGDFFPETHEKSYDKLHYIAQEQSRTFALCLKIPSTDITGTTVILPTATLRANKVMAFDSNGNVIVSNVNLSDIEGGVTLAMQWATLTTGLVASTDYSSKAYAIGGTGVTGGAGAAKEWAVLTGSFVTGTSMSAKDWAVGTFNRGSSGFGSAKDWAVYTGGTVDGTDFSSKYHAQNAATSAAAALASQNAAAASAAVVNYRYGGTSGGTANAQTLTPSTALTSYTGARIAFLAGVTNTASVVTMNVSGLGAVQFKKRMRGTSVLNLSVGDILAGRYYTAQYDGTFFILEYPNVSQGIDLASASTLDLTSASAMGTWSNVTGTTTINAITLPQGFDYKIVHTGIHQITNGASLICLTGANITTAVGDISYWHGEASGVVRMIGYSRANGQPLAGTSGALTGITSMNGGQLAGLRNVLINGDFRNWHYATTYALTTTVAYGSANRWAFSMGTSAAGIANRDTTAGNFPAGMQCCLKLGRNSGSSLTNYIDARQALESVNSIPLQGKQVTLSFYAKAGANFSSSGGNLSVDIWGGTGTDQAVGNMTTSWTGGASFMIATQAITSTLTRYSFTGTVPSNCTQIGIRLAYIPTGTAGADDNVYISAVQLEPGTVATPFEDIGQALTDLRCARYLPAYFAYGTNDFQWIGQATGNNQTTFCPIFHVPVRKAPTGAIFSSAGHFTVSRAAGSNAVTSINFGSAGKHGAYVQANVSGTPFVADDCYFVGFTNASGYMLFTGSEL